MHSSPVPAGSTRVIDSISSQIKWPSEGGRGRTRSPSWDRLDEMATGRGIRLEYNDIRVSLERY